MREIPRRFTICFVAAASAVLSLSLPLHACPGALLSLPGPDGRVTRTVRRVACPAGHVAGLAAPLTNADFASGLDAWSVTIGGGAATPGTVTPSAGGALLAEGDSLLVTLSQTFLLPSNTRELSVAVFVEPGFDRAARSLPDAFEVSLLDASNAPLTGSWDPLATSSFNLQEDGTTHLASQASWDGETLRLDLLPRSSPTEVTLYFDLIGADQDTASGLRVDQIALEADTGDGRFVRGNANSDRRVDISDGIFTLTYLFLGGPEPGCLDAADANNDSRIDLSDAVYSFNFLFLGGPLIPPPYPGCGEDVGAPDSLGCARESCP